MTGTDTPALSTGRSTPSLEANERVPLLTPNILETGGYSASAAATSTRQPKNESTRKKIKQRFAYYVPSTYWLPNYSFSSFGGDFLAGATVACVLIPQSISYATSLAKLSPVAGLASAAVPGIIYALLGSSRQLNVAPEAALSLLVGQAVAAELNEQPHSYPNDPAVLSVAVATIITFQVGVFSFLLGIFRLGFIDVVLSRALLRGFVTAIAVVIMVEQLIPMLGLVELAKQHHLDTTIDKIVFLLEYAIPNGHEKTASIAFTALAILIVIRLTKAELRARFKWNWVYFIPEVLIVVVASTALSGMFKWNEDGVAILGTIPLAEHAWIGFPLKPTNLRFMKSTTSLSVLIAVVGFLDSIVAAKQNGARFGYSISPNRELVALGAGNLVGSFVPGLLPAFGSITRSRLNADFGGRTQMASLVCSTLVILATFFLLPALEYLPKCVLGSVISLVVWSLLAEAPHDLAFYFKMGAWIDLALMSLTFILTLAWNVEVGVTCSVIISLLLVVRRSSKTRISILGHIPGTDRWKPVNENPDAEEAQEGVLIIRIRESLDFANTAQLKERLRRIELYGLDKAHPSEEPRRSQATKLVFHMLDVESIDASATQIFYELLETYKARGVGLFVTHLRPQPREYFEKSGIFELLGPKAFHENVAAAMGFIDTIR
ncbi:sulfate anion transporter [Sistotremastrum suecicum HHB10207 ss-3]|uniref:Sulfate anion transporter n=1 Tax=Sistotremastrum suecicum HHB10207 ss-3 TaxID=1314776 RepID=A0A166GPH6_9AGAM|nr:sulfate anion transporter [Sistotremastrum suecicum HHB10207 ss-3]